MLFFLDIVQGLLMPCLFTKSIMDRPQDKWTLCHCVLCLSINLQHVSGTTFYCPILANLAIVFHRKFEWDHIFILTSLEKKTKQNAGIATVVVYFCTNLHTYCRNCLRHCLFSGSTFPTLFGLFSPLTLIELSYESSGTLAQEILILCLTILLKAQINAMRN